MSNVAKYNLFKFLSMLITSIPIIAVTFYYSDVIVQSSGASVSVTGIVAILLIGLFFKNKIAENFKIPSPFIISAALFVTILLVEQVLLPAKYTCLTAMLACGVDELTFKNVYKRVELLLPDKKKAYKHFGFYFCRTSTLMKDG